MSQHCWEKLSQVAPFNTATINSEHHADGVGHLHCHTGVLKGCTWSLFFYFDLEYDLDEVFFSHFIMLLSLFIYSFIYIFFFLEAAILAYRNSVPKEDSNFYSNYFTFLSVRLLVLLLKVWVFGALSENILISMWPLALNSLVLLNSVIQNNLFSGC